MVLLEPGHHCIVKLMPVTDCRSLFDAVQRLAISLQEKRVQIDLASIREACGGGMDGSAAIRWVPTGQMRADGLTKWCPKLRLQLAEFVNKPFVVLTKKALEHADDTAAEIELAYLPFGQATRRTGKQVTWRTPFEQNS